MKQVGVSTERSRNILLPFTVSEQSTELVLHFFKSTNELSVSKFRDSAELARLA